MIDLPLPDLSKADPKPGDTFILTVKGPLSEEEFQSLCSYLKPHLKGADLIVLMDGMTLAPLAASDEVLQSIERVEAKLDTLLEALAKEDDEEPAEGRTLDGDPAGRERDQTQSLG